MIWGGIDNQGNFIFHWCDNFASFYANEISRPVQPGEKRETLPDQLKLGSLYYRREILDAEWVRYCEVNPTAVYMDDGASPHTSEKTQLWWKRHVASGHYAQCLRYMSGVEDVNPFRWPADSPDLNPIENFWARIRHAKNQTFPRTSEEIKRVSQSYFLSLEGRATAKKLHNTFKKRLEMCIAADGHKIRY